MHVEKLYILIIKFQIRLYNVICYKAYYGLTVGNIGFKINCYNEKDNLL